MTAKEDEDDEFKAPPGVERWPDGEAILVLRPQNPTVALALAQIAYDKQSLDALREATSGPCRYLGFLKHSKKNGPQIVDENGANVEPVKAGDIFVSRHELSQPS